MAVGPLSTEEFALRVQREFGGKIVSGYGMTETGVGTTLGFIDEDEAHSAATSGYPLPGYEFRVVDPLTGEECLAGAPGEIHVRSYQMMTGYLKDEERTAAVLDAEGWLRTGDVGVLLDDGYLRVLGRYKDMLRVAGENVDPAEVEALYASRDEIASVVVVGVPDDRLEEVPCLCVELQEGYHLDEALSRELLSLADGRLASFKRPRYVVGFDPIPMTASGKIAREEVRAQAHADLGLSSEATP
jgi:fatty-acyl-CoA synthase